MSKEPDKTMADPLPKVDRTTLIRLASQFYPDDAVEYSWDKTKEKITDRAGDSLARFIAGELDDLFDAEQHLEEILGMAAHQIDIGIQELTEVRDGLASLGVDVVAAKFLTWSVNTGDPATPEMLRAWMVCGEIAKEMRFVEGSVANRLKSMLPGWDKKVPSPEAVQKCLEKLVANLKIGEAGETQPTTS